MHDRSERGCARVTGPDRQSVRERRQRAQARRRPGGAPGRNGDRPHAGTRRRDRARRRVVAAGRGDLRVLGRRHLQRGDQRAPRRHPGRLRPGRRHERAPAGARSSARPDPAAERIANGTPRRISLGRHQRPHLRVQRRHRLRCRARAPRRREWAGGPTASGPATSPSAGPWCRALVDHRLPLRGGARGRGARPGRLRAGRQLLAVHLRGRARTAVRARRLLRGRPRHRRADRGTTSGGAAPRHRRRSAAGRARATCSSGTTSTGS